METKKFNPKLRALMAIRNLSVVLERNYNQMNEIEQNLDFFNENATLIINERASEDIKKKWINTLKNVKDDISSIKIILNSVKDKIKNKDRSDSSELWHKYEKCIEDVKNGYRLLEEIGYEGLEEDQHIHWKKDICNIEKAILPLIISHAESCRMELEMIEKYTPREIDSMTETILAHIPSEYSFEEAEKYEKDYLKAIDEIKQEFSEKKNLWDRFLDILAGGKHQTPAERVMMKRWLEGQKGEL